MSAREPIIIDASNLILGRMCTYVARHALAGDDVIVVNAEKAVISGKRNSLVAEAKHRLETRTLGSQRKAPKHPRRPDIYVRRVIRGMLPWKKARGKSAFKRVRVFIGVPEDFSGKPLLKVEDADASKLRSTYITVADLAEEIGWRQQV